MDTERLLSEIQAVQRVETEVAAPDEGFLLPELLRNDRQILFYTLD